jgi:tyrosine-protein kinase Etk/Wzc
METDRSQNEIFDLKDFLIKLRQYWKSISLCIVVAITIAYMFSHYTQKIFEVSATVIIKKEKPMIDIQSMSALDALENPYVINNETERLKSTIVSERALAKVNFGISYYENVPFGNVELYHNNPFEVIPDSAFPQPTDMLFRVQFLNANEFELFAEGNNVVIRNLKNQKVKKVVSKFLVKQKFTINQPIITDRFSFTLQLPDNASLYNNFKEKTYYFQINSKENLLAVFRKYKVDNIKSSTVLQISMKGGNIAKMVDFLNALCEAYIEKTVEKKNISAANTIEFIEDQLIEISDSLKFSEDQLQTYQSAHKVMNMDFQSQQVFTSLENLQNQKAELVIKQKYFYYLKSYLQKSNDVKNYIAPSSIGINDPALSSALNQLMEITNDRAELSYNLKKDNPYVSAYDIKAQSLKKSIVENLNNLIDANSISLQEMDQRINELTEKAGKLPKTQRELFGFERVYKLNDALYTYLLTKRSEIQISKAALMPDNEVVNEANPRDAILVSPNPKKNLILAFILGFGIPMLLIIIKDYFSEKIRSIDDIEKVADFPILGHIIRNKSGTLVPILDDQKSLVAESFRSIRTNFQFVAPINDKHVIVITSSMMDEGKSFTSINLAASFALYTKRTVLLCFDLRKPMRTIPFNLSNDKGLSTYLSGNCELESIIQRTNNENLNIILPGPIPPNPNELIASQKTKELIHVLTQWFDYIVIDTPPVGMVADALLLIHYSDTNIFMVRHNHTRKSMFKQLISTLKKRNIENVNILINDLPLTNENSGYGYGYGYGYNYNYGYGYGYYHKEKSSIFSKIFPNGILKKEKKTTI